MSAPKDAETNLFEQQESFDFGPPRPFVRPALAAERRSVLEVIGRAFHDDPVTCHLFPKEHKRAIRWARFSGLAIKSMGDTAHILTTESVQGAAVWQLPNGGRLGALTNFGIAFRFLMLAGLGARRAIRRLRTKRGRDARVRRRARRREREREGGRGDQECGENASV